MRYGSMASMESVMDRCSGDCCGHEWLISVVKGGSMSKEWRMNDVGRRVTFEKKKNVFMHLFVSCDSLSLSTHRKLQ
ncbi:hypothetical protein RIF29_39110 [Crotalaria pallida]|uniref:Uncharacterized protein n=1 Tax=Crotalaria pallida TaxID=3830 RepID=A0AAN9HM66_CROPI